MSHTSYLTTRGCLQKTELWAAGKKKTIDYTRKSRPHSEYSVEDEDEQIDNNANDEEGKLDSAKEMLLRTKRHESSTSASPVKKQQQKFQYAALSPGCVAQVLVGDIALARKAWKKRRRSGSPLLVPCSVVNLDRRSCLRWNTMYLLEKFGSSKGGKKGGISISFSEINQRYRTHLKSSLAAHAQTLGYTNSQELVEALWNEKSQETYGVSLVYSDGDRDGTLYLQAPLSRMRAQKRAKTAVILQVAEDPNDQEALLHTGIVRNRRESNSEHNGQVSSSTTSSLDEEGVNDSTLAHQQKEEAKNVNFYQLQPLSAALRINPRQDDAIMEPDSRHSAVVFEYSSVGDGGAPLLTLSLNPARNQVRQALKLSSTTKDHQPGKHQSQRILSDLSVGDGPLQGKVVRFIKDGVLVDCGVGRSLSKGTAISDGIQGYTPVLAVLKFKDAVVSEMEEKGDAVCAQNSEAEDDVISGALDMDFNFADIDDDEEVEDITHLFELADDGSLAYTDPETEETQIIATGNDEDLNIEEELLSNEAQISDENAANDSLELDEEWIGRLSNTNRGTRKRLRIGDQIPVFIKSVQSKKQHQSGSQLIVTMDGSAVKGKSAKQVKKDVSVNKKLDRLDKQLRDSFKRGNSKYKLSLENLVKELQGKECNGIVKATSNTGDWFYVKPESPENEDDNFTWNELPVGVATVDDDAGVPVNERLAQGDTVRIQLKGIDRDRGQLAMRVLRKLSP